MKYIYCEFGKLASIYNYKFIIGIKKILYIVYREVNLSVFRFIYKRVFVLYYRL